MRRQIALAAGCALLTASPALAQDDASLRSGPSYAPGDYEGAYFTPPRPAMPQGRRTAQPGDDVPPEAFSPYAQTTGSSRAAPAPRPFRMPRPDAGEDRRPRATAQAVGGAAQANAASTTRRRVPPPRPSRSVLGPRIELRAGWDGVRAEGGNADGIAYGVGVGFDHVIAPNLRGGGLFLGGFASADFSSAEGRTGDAATDTGENGASTAIVTETAIEQRRDVEVGLRTGYATGRFAVYALAAFTNTEVRSADTVTVVLTSPDGDADVGEPQVGDAASLFGDGWRVGAGAEASLTEAFYAKAEYRYSRYGAGDEKHQVVTGVGLRF